MSTAIHFITIVEGTLAYFVAMAFYGLYPLLMAIIWATTALVFWARRDRKPHDPPETGIAPRVSVLIPAYCEEALIGPVVRETLQIDYPNFEVLVVNDGSTDSTAQRLEPFLSDARFRLLNKPHNEGKGRALNDGIEMATGELILIMDADAIPDRHLIRMMAPHFSERRVGAVAGNARVRNKNGVLTKLQAIEFTSIVSLLRRAQRIWGTVMCVSGVVGMFRKNVLVEAGGFSPGMATEDIDLTWRIQKLGYDVRYESGAMVWMIVPETLRVWWKQRRRWALGLGQVLRRHAGVLVSWKLRRMLPLYLEAMLSTLWAIDFVLISLFWLVSYSLGHPPRGGSPFPNLWGMILVTVCILQLLCGVIVDFRYEPGIARHFHIAPLYPFGYWLLLAITTSIYTIKGLLQPLRLDRATIWRIDHQYRPEVER